MLRQTTKHVVCHYRDYRLEGPVNQWRHGPADVYFRIADVMAAAARAGYRVTGPLDTVPHYDGRQSLLAALVDDRLVEPVRVRYTAATWHDL